MFCSFSWFCLLIASLQFVCGLFVAVVYFSWLNLWFMFASVLILGFGYL